MKLRLNLKDLESIHDAICTCEEMAHDEPKEFGDYDHYHDLRRRLKCAIDTTKAQSTVEVE
ncbi:hypothetical protein KAR91_06000 [Candidatus Pacearchaeota archaeon]|nr:hypothetical protein [Candidatus Pacearchaeota archaeon]